MDNKKVLLGFLGGLAVGAIAGILLAPDKGSNTRKAIVDMAGDVTDAVENSIHDALDKVKEKYVDAVKEGEKLADKAVATMNEVKADVSGRLS
jgi:gas vesicle protein